MCAAALAGIAQKSEPPATGEQSCAGVKSRCERTYRRLDDGARATCIPGTRATKSGASSAPPLSVGESAATWMGGPRPESTRADALGAPRRRGRRDVRSTSRGVVPSVCGSLLREDVAHGFELAADALPLAVELREYGGHVPDDEGVESEAGRDGDDREHLLDVMSGGGERRRMRKLAKVSVE